MRQVISKINFSYIGLILFLNIVAILIIIISINYLKDIYYTYKRIIACLLIISSIIFIIFVWKEAFKINKVIVDNQGIEIFNYKSSTRIQYSEIETIEVRKHRTYVNRIPITNGYFYSELRLKTNKNILISPDKFENYQEIMELIRINITKLNNT